MNPRHYLKNILTRGLVSKHDNRNRLRFAQHQTVEFQEYLRTQQSQLSQENTSSLDYRQEQDTFSHHEQIPSSNEEDFRKNLIQIGQNYTFAQDFSSQRQQNQKYLGFKGLPSIKRNKRRRISQISQSYMRNYPQLNLDSSDFTEKNPRFQSQFSQQLSNHERQISFSDNEEDQGVTIYNAKAVEQEMFLKISEQTKEILTLQQKLYYYEDFCKRLLKSHQQDKQQLEKLANECTALKKASKQKNKRNQQKLTKLEQRQNEITQQQKELKKKQKLFESREKEHKLKQKEFQRKEKQMQEKIEELKSKQKELQRLIFLQNQKNRQAQKKVLIERQNFQEITHLEQEKKLINEKYQLLLSNYDKVTSKSILLENEMLKYQKENEILRGKYKNIQNVNNILQKQITELNIKIFKFQKQMEQITCQNYASNLTRIKCMTETSADDFYNKKPSITAKFDTTGYQKSFCLRR